MTLGAGTLSGLLEPALYADRDAADCDDRKRQAPAVEDPDDRRGATCVDGEFP
jgi:hypothetical protein